MRKITKRLALLISAFLAFGGTFYCNHQVLAAPIGQYQLNGGAWTEYDGSILDGSVLSGNFTDNKLEVKIASGSLGSANLIVGSYKNNPSETLSGNTVKLTDLSGSSTAYTVNALNGTCVAGDGKAIGNSVEIDTAMVLTVISGAVEDEGEANKNSLKMSGSYSHNVLGGYLKRGKANENSLTLDDTVSNKVFGGCIDYGEASKNSVKISGKSRNREKIVGGLVRSIGNAYENKVVIEDSEGLEVTGGGYNSSATVQAVAAIGNEVLIARSTVEDVYGGTAYEGEASRNKVSISASTGELIMGGFTSVGAANQNIVEMIASSTAHGVIGGYSMSGGEASNNRVIIKNSDVNQDVDGGFAFDGDANSNTVEIYDSTVRNVLTAGNSNNSNYEANNNTLIIKNTKVGGKIYGGYVSGSTAKGTGNKLIVKGEGSVANNLLNFNSIEFDLEGNFYDESMMTVLNSDSGLSLEDVTINAKSLNLDEEDSVTLLHSRHMPINYGNVQYQIGGIAGDSLTLGEKDETNGWVRVGGYEYKKEADKLSILCNSAAIAAKYGDSNGIVAATDNTITLSGNAQKYKKIYGAYCLTGDAEGATVKIASALDLSNTSLIGGYSKNGSVKGNTLEVSEIGARVNGIEGFETMNFILPFGTKDGDTMLTAKGKVDMAITKNVGVNALAATDLKADDSVNLIKSENGIENYAPTNVSIEGLTTKKGNVSLVDDKILKLKVEAEAQNGNTKAPSEGVAAVAAAVNELSAVTTGRLNRSMVSEAATANGGMANFASLSGGHSRIETGSYVENDSWNLGIGVGKKGLSRKNPNSTYGLFMQYGKSDFETHNGDLKGDGDAKAIGGGLMFHHDSFNGYYYDGSIFAGKVDAKWSSKFGGYEDEAPYHGFSFGMGHKSEPENNRVFETYGIYTFSHIGSMEGNLPGTKYDFDSVVSSRLRLGCRFEEAKNASFKPYYGLAWEHEFSGDANASINLGKVEAPSLKGDTGIFEAGCKWKRGNWDIGFNVEGSFGKRKGLTGAVKCFYNF